MGSKNANSTELIRDPDVSIRRKLDSPALLVTDATVSRRHILARQTEAGAWIQDQDSTKGTFFGGSRVKELVLGPGATIRAGRTADVRLLMQGGRVFVQSGVI